MVNAHRCSRYAERMTANNVSFEYTSVDEDGEVIGYPTVTYRWLGEIYAKQNHCRLYWKDDNPLNDNGYIKKYDGQRARVRSWVESLRITLIPRLLITEPMVRSFYSTSL